MKEGISAQNIPQEHKPIVPGNPESHAGHAPAAPAPTREQERKTIADKVFTLRSRIASENERYASLRKELGLGMDAERPSHREDEAKLKQLEERQAELGKDDTSKNEADINEEEAPQNEPTAEDKENAMEKEKKLGEALSAMQRNSSILFGVLVTQQAQGAPAALGILDQAKLVMIPIQMETLHAANLLTPEKAKELTADFKKVIEGRSGSGSSGEGVVAEVADSLVERQFTSLGKNIRTIEEVLYGKGEMPPEVKQPESNSEIIKESKEDAQQ